jgi:hypothetical protein
MKIYKLLLTSILLVTILSSCNLPSSSGLPTQTVYQNLSGTAVAMTLLSNPTQTQAAIITPTYAVPTVTASLIPTPLPPNTPVWLAYNYTCELTDGGGDMTMNLSWTDRSNSEENYKVYRDGQVIATLAPNITAYVDVVFIPSGKTVSYSIEVFGKDWSISTSTITHGCQ